MTTDTIFQDLKKNNLQNLLKNNLGVAELFMRQISYAFYDNLFVSVIRGYNVEEAKEYVSMMVDFYMKGIVSI